MRILVFGAGVLGSYYAARLHEGGHDVALLARGARLEVLRRHGVQLAQGDGPARRVAVPVVSEPDDSYDVALVLVRTQQLPEALRTLAPHQLDVVTMVNWAAGPEPLERELGAGRLMLGFPTAGGVMDGDVVRYVAPQVVTRLMPLPLGEAHGGSSERVEALAAAFRQAKINSSVEKDMDGWLRTHAAYVTPMALAVARGGSPTALADDPAAVRGLVADLKGHLAGVPRLRPKAVGLLGRLPDGLLVAALTRFLRTPTAELGLQSTSPASVAEMELLDEQLRATRS